LDPLKGNAVYANSRSRKTFQYGSTTGFFAAKAGRVLDLYERVWEDTPLGADDFVLSADEKTSVQTRRRKQPTLSPASTRMGNRRRLRAALSAPPGADCKKRYTLFYIGSNLIKPGH
jgi:hypothetical protein